jgi:hypothetical protein
MRRLKVEFDAKRGVYQRVVQEEDVLGEIKQMLEINGARVYRSIERVPKCYRCGQWLGASEPGTPDISGYFKIPVNDGCEVMKLHPFWLEIKRPKKNHKRPAQIARIEQIKADGGIAAIVESWAQVLALLDDHLIPVKVRG